MKAILRRTVLTCGALLLGGLGVAQAGYDHHPGHYYPHRAGYYSYEGDYYHPRHAGHARLHRMGARDASQDWETVCAHTGDKNRACVAYTELESLVGGVWGVANALSLSANEPGRYRLGWSPRLYVPDGVHPLRLQVDHRYRRSISPGLNGYRGDEFGGYRIETNAALINAMKRGRELTLSYTDIFGDTRQVRFSLMGVTDSLRFVDQRLTRPVASTASSRPASADAPASLARVYRHK